MIGLARKSGFAFSASPDDWKLVRFDKQIDVDAAGYSLRELAAGRRSGSRCSGVRLNA